jgi:hypothetical protein
MAGDGQWWKLTHAGMLPRGPTKAKRTTLRKEPLENGSMRLYLQGMKAGQHPKQKDKYESQHGIMAPFARAIIDVTGRPP